MAPDDRSAAPSLEGRLFASGERFDFFQAVRLLRLLRPGPEPSGRTASPRREPVRLRARVDLTFPPSDVASVRAPARPGDAPELTVGFFGVGGALGPLPRPFAQWLWDRTRAGDTGPRDFLDLFHHRLLSLLYRGRQLRRVWLEEGPPEDYALARYLYALLGLGTPGLRDRLAVEDRTLLRYAGLLAHRPVSVGALEAMLSDWLGQPVHPRLPRGGWMALDAEQWTRLGAGGQNQRLGQDAVLGRRAWNPQAGLSLDVGPLSWSRYQGLLPGGRTLRGLCSLTRFALGTNVEVALVLRPRLADIPEQPLGARGGARLGWTSFLRSRPGREGVQRVALSPRHMKLPPDKDTPP
ncbi:MAG: type VI secretion system baseplate subunit TssG [Cystobacter sp.]